MAGPANRAAILRGLSALLAYPRVGFRDTAARLLETVAADGPGDEGSVAGHVRAFDAETSGYPLEKMEELYTMTFDLNPAASLEVGWQLYGEAYERGAFLVKMRALLREYGVPEGEELPDHLATLLRAMGEMPAEEAAGPASDCVRRGISKMIAAFPRGDNPYLHLLKAASAAAGEISVTKEGAQP